MTIGRAVPDLLALLGRAPDPGDVLEEGGVRFKVLDVEGTRIERLEVEFLPDEDADRGEEPRAAEG